MTDIDWQPTRYTAWHGGELAQVSLIDDLWVVHVTRPGGIEEMEFPSLGAALTAGEALLDPADVPPGLTADLAALIHDHVGDEDA